LLSRCACCFRDAVFAFVAHFLLVWSACCFHCASFLLFLRVLCFCSALFALV
jgi:hypothetical protein